MNRPLERVKCRRFVKELGSGLTSPLLVGAQTTDNTTLHLVLKLKKPPGQRGHFGSCSLAREMLAVRLAAALGLPVLRHFEAEVSREFADAAPESVRERLRANLGSNFATEYRTGTAQLAKGYVEIRDTQLEVLERLLAFDAALLNADRKAEKSNLLTDGEHYWLIDHSLCMPPDEGWRYLKENVEYPADAIAEHCAFCSLERKQRDFEALFSEWGRVVAEVVLAGAVDRVPKDWGNDEDRKQVLEFLKRRPTRFADLVSRLRGVVR